jgi:branched-subunit amino acid ABC-type transport system permease component
MTEILTVAILGLGLGAMYTLAAQGLVLIYRGSGVMNFAQGAVGICGAYIWYELHLSHGWPYFPALIAALIATLALGALIHLFLMRPLRQASPLARTMATVGLLLTLQSLVVIHYGTETIAVHSSLPTSAPVFFGVPVPEDRLILLGIAIVLSAVLWAIYRFTSFGRATRAGGDYQDSAASRWVGPEAVG